MPSKNKSIALTNSSIHLFVNGFSFYTPSRTEFNPITENIGDFESVLEELLNFYPKEMFSGTQIISYHQPSTFVPIKFFDKNLLKNYLQILGNFDDNSALNFDLLKAQMDASHEIGIETPFYFAIGWSELDAVNNPEWIIKNKMANPKRKI